LRIEPLSFSFLILGDSSIELIPTMRMPTLLLASFWGVSLLLVALLPAIQAQEAPSLTDIVQPAPTDPSLFSTYQSTITRDQTSSPDDLAYTTTSDNHVLLVGASTTATLPANETTLSGNATTTPVESAVLPTNTRPCNGYPEFCERKYSNITEVAAHNSPFVRTGSMASNQALDVTVQLNDGIRMRRFSYTGSPDSENVYRFLILVSLQSSFRPIIGMGLSVCATQAALCSMLDLLRII
jgi:hypothetical protein